VVRPTLWARIRRLVSKLFSLASYAFGAMTPPFAFVHELLVTLAGLGFVCLVTALFVIIARFAASRLLGKDDGSSLF
jgi:VIT1/CCC1 family predicted Fe2+/Mn2+ transporter